MMVKDMKKNELTEQEMNIVAGGADLLPHFWKNFQNTVKREEEARKKAEAANQPGAHPHGSGASGGW